MEILSENHYRKENVDTFCLQYWVPHKSKKYVHASEMFIWCEIAFTGSGNFLISSLYDIQRSNVLFIGQLVFRLFLLWSASFSFINARIIHKFWFLHLKIKREFRFHTLWFHTIIFISLYIIRLNMKEIHCYFALISSLFWGFAEWLIMFINEVIFISFGW